MRREISHIVKIPAVYNFIKIDGTSVTPIYIQLSNCIIGAMDASVINEGEWLPSINDISFNFEIARDTVDKSYRYLKKLGFIGSHPGKGYYLIKPKTGYAYNVFLLFNKLSEHKKIIYDAFVNALGGQAHIDFSVYYGDYSLFKKLICQTNHLDYSHYVLIPHFSNGEESRAHEIINTIPKEKLVLLDKVVPQITGGYAAVFQNFEKDIYQALKMAHDDLRSYRKLKLLFPQNSSYPKEIITGFTKFCIGFNFDYQLIADITTDTVVAGDVFINVTEEDFVKLVQHLSLTSFRIGKEVGVLSYNETPTKKIILNGISTISSDFNYMGVKAAELVMSKSIDHMEVPFYYLKRRSL